MNRAGLRTLHQRATVTIASAAVLATICAGADPRAPAARVAGASVDLVAAIDQSPTTIGLADSNLVRLGDHALIDKQLDMMQSLGVQNVRIGISWISTQLTEHGNFFWGDTDYVVNEAHRRGMGVLGVLHETPNWAKADPDALPLSGMPRAGAFAAFAGAVAERYAGKISALEVWNEPNGRFFLNPVDPAGYTELVKAAYTAIKAHDDPLDPDDDITVVAGVLGSGRTLGNDFTMNPIDFLQGMYDNGAHGFFDAFSFHPYHYDIPFSEGATQSDSPILQLRDIRALMEQHGDGALKVWASEYGLPTTPLNPSAPWLYNSPDKQAEFLEDFLRNWQRENGTGPIFIYSTRDLNSGSPSDQDNFGVWYTDWSEKPAVQVIRDFLDSLDPDYPIIEAIRNAVNWIVDTTGRVISGLVDIGLAVADAIIDATVWVVKTVARVAVDVIGGVVDLTSRVVRGIAEAIGNAVTWVVDRVESCLGIEESAPPAPEAGSTPATSLRSEARMVSVDAIAEQVEPVADHSDAPRSEQLDIEEPTSESENVVLETVEPDEPDVASPQTFEPETGSDSSFGIGPEAEEETPEETVSDVESSERAATPDEASNPTVNNERNAESADNADPRTAAPA
ncbi:Cellulase (glycosyl hydrolase family 5) [Mycolicibacterium neoaurum]|uniref:cellulase family glycosylhydrolase n=1 Tax=Mycolicibacterium neoaurum TaxID=1795 RepID=UPI000690E34A|nr:cellulase family glycosylhydrolase [Mycolicibacterium neoaurum]SDD17556.1 Cellulase (glycosyl hydrolase family 5) [Mycolicibacterium neoaurum]